MTTTESAYRPPEGLVLTPAMRAVIDADREHQRAGARQDQAAVDGWLEEATERTFGPLDAWLGETA